MSHYTSEKAASVKELTANDFEDKESHLLKNKDCSFVLFYANWCGHCQAVTEEWIKFANLAGFINVGAFDCANEVTIEGSRPISNTSHLLKIKEELPELVRGYPTFVFYNKGEYKEHYNGKRDAASFLEAATRVCRSKT